MLEMTYIFANKISIQPGCFIWLMVNQTNYKLDRDIIWRKKSQEKPRNAKGGPKAKTRAEGQQALRVFPYNVIFSASLTSKEGYILANGLSREYYGQYL